MKITTQILYLEALNWKITTKCNLYAPCVTENINGRHKKKILPKHVPEIMQADEKTTMFWGFC